MKASAQTSLRARMTLGFIASFLGFVLFACAGNFLWTRHAARSNADERVRAAARLIAHEWDGDTTTSGIDRAIAYSREDARRHGWLNALDDISLAIVSEPGAALGASRHPSLPYPITDKRRWITASERGRRGIVVAGMDGQAIDRRLRAQTLVLLIFALPLTAVAGVAAWMLVGRTLRPIGALADQASVASADPLHVRLLPPSDDAEVRYLVATLNQFLERLNQNTRAREQFYAAAAHELRTPLAVLSGSVEVALSRPREPAEYRETLADLQDQTRRLTRLTEDLLTLNRLHTAAVSGVDEDAELLSLSGLCESTWTLLVPLASQRGLQVAMEMSVAGEAWAEPTQAAILVRNLIDNAVRYATAGGRVVVALYSHEDGKSLCLRVYNDYPAVLELEVDRLWEPFYRADKSRASATGGNGLGLAICRRIADRNGWRLAIARELGGIVVTVVLPDLDHRKA